MSEYECKKGTSRRKSEATNRGMYGLPYKWIKDDGKRVDCGTEPWPTDVICPDCGKAEVRWAEAGYVPGHRICPRCGSHWELNGDLDQKETEKPRWILRRARFYQG